MGEAEYWDEQAAAFDEEPDHGLRDPAVRAAWAAGVDASFRQGDAAAPPYAAGSTGAGIPAAACRELVLRHRREAVLERLDDPALWGREIDDERYVIVSGR